MRKILALVFIFLFSSFLVFATISYDVAIGFDQRAVIEPMMLHAMGNRKDVDIKVEEFFEKDGVFRLSFLLEGKEYSLSAPTLDSLGHFLDNALLLEESLFLPGEHITYVNGNIIACGEDLPKGNLYYAVDGEGNKKALLGFDRVNGNGINLLRPLWVSSIFAGYTIEKGPSWALDVTGASTLQNRDFSISASLKQISWLRNFRPSISFTFYRSGNKNHYLGGLGAEVRAPLSGLFNTRFSMIEDAAVYAGVSILLGYGLGFEWGAGYTFGYEQILFGRMYYRIGYIGSTFINPALVISMGVMF